MSPRLAHVDGVYRTVGHPKLTGDGPLPLTVFDKLSNGLHLIFCERSTPTLRPKRHTVPSLAHHISRVVGGRSLSQVLWVDATGIVAGVQTARFGPSAIGNIETETVGAHRLTPHGNGSISVFIGSRQPKPTRIRFLHVPQKPFFIGHTFAGQRHV
jgi:hypothetical protein